MKILASHLVLLLLMKWDTTLGCSMMGIEFVVGLNAKQLKSLNSWRLRLTQVPTHLLGQVVVGSQ